MKTFLAAIFPLMILAAPVAHGQTIDLRTYTCGEYAALAEETQDFVAMWLDGYLADDETPDGLQVDFSGTDAEDIKAYCTKNPASILVQAVEQIPEAPAN